MNKIEKNEFINDIISILNEYTYILDKNKKKNNVLDISKLEMRVFRNDLAIKLLKKNFIKK